jgi:pimeloyl-ACP methyl ester carboxylesterase
VRVPTLVIWGERDQALLIGNLEGLDRQVEDLHVIRIPEGSHWVVHEQPARIGALIRDFIGRRD